MRSSSQHGSHESYTTLLSVGAFCDFSAPRPRFVARLAPSDSPQSRGPCPRAGPPSPRPSRSASEVARSPSPRSPTRAVRLRTNPGPNILLFITAVGPPAVLASLKPLNNSIQLPLHVPCIVSNNYTAIGSGIYITKTRCLLIYWPQYVHTYLQCYTSVGCACRVKLWMTKGVVFFFPYRTAIRLSLIHI